MYLCELIKYFDCDFNLYGVNEDCDEGAEFEYMGMFRPRELYMLPDKLQWGKIVVHGLEPAGLVEPVLNIFVTYKEGGK